MSDPKEQKSIGEPAPEPVTVLLQDTGCMELHIKAQECIAKTHDWTKCPDEVNAVQQCLIKFAERNEKKEKK